MTTPSAQRTRYGTTWDLARILLFISAVLFVLGAFAAGGDSLGTIPDWSWFGGAFAAWVLSGAV
jgi:uncharacterized membrane protein YdcZ (DUF606 family)